MKMLNKPIIVGITGVARSGKDTFARLLGKELAKLGMPSKRIALADRLKADLGQLLLNKVEINPFTKDSSKKELIRPLFVAYGALQRRRTKGKYWTNLVQPELENCYDNGISVLIPDIRYVEYEYDEYHWLKANGGILVYVSRYVLDSDGVKKYIPPANSDESSNSRVLHGLADYHIDWESSDDSHKLQPYIDNFIKFLG